MQKETLPRVGAVIAAAGKPVYPRTSETSDFPEKLGSITALQRMIRTLQRVEADPIVIVTGYEAEKIQKQAASLHAICLFHEKWESTDMLASAKIGLAYVKDLCDVVLFTPADIPLFTADTAAALLSSDAPAAIPAKNGRRGHPLLLRTSLIPAILSYEGEDGLRGALRSLGIVRQTIPVEDEGVLFNTKYDTNWEELVQKQNAQPLQMHVDITLSQELPFFDTHTASFLRVIERTQSVRSACKQMNLSYSKGWHMLNRMEEQLHYPVVVRNPGGAGGGCTYLSPKGKEFLEKYEQLIRKVSAFSKEMYQKLYEE